MAAPSYTTDLATFDLAENLAAWIEFTNMGGGGNPDEADNDNEIQGTYMTSQTSTTASLISMGKDNGSGITLPTNGVFLIWHNFTSPGLLATYANGGMRAVVGSSSTNWKAWATGGGDVAPNPYGGWQNIPIDPTLTADYTNGSPSGTLQVVGAGCNLTAGVAKGQPHQIDAIRWGRAESRFNGGDLTNGYATFAGFATINDANAASPGYNRWGLIQVVSGGYQWKGLMVLGYTSAVDFRDSNVNVFVQDCRKVSSVFNKIEIRQSTSRVDWTGVNITNVSPSSNASRGDLVVVDNADVNFESCTFTDIGYFTFQSNSTVNSCIFRRCGLVTRGNAALTSCTFDRTNDTVKALTIADPSNSLTSFVFNSSGTKHAIEITQTGTYTFTNCTFSGYASSNGSTGNETIYNNSGGLVTINHSGTSGNLTYKNEGSSTTTLVGNTRTLTLTNIMSGSEIRIYLHDTTTEVSGNDDVTVGYHEYSYQFVSNTYVDIVVHHEQYIYYRIDNYLLADSNSSLPIAQQYDRQYLNPT